MLQTVATYTNPIEAHIVRGRLACEDVDAYVIHEHHIWTKWSISLALGGIKIQVTTEGLEQARSLINEIESGEFSTAVAEMELEDSMAKCDRCNSEQIIQLDWPRKLSLVSLFILLIPVPYTNYLTKCNTCNHIWINSSDRPYPLTSISLIMIFTILCFSIFTSSLFHLCKINAWSYVCI